MTCLDENLALALASGAPVARRAELEAHLDACPACRRLVAEVARGASRPPSTSGLNTGSGAQAAALPAALPAGSALGRYLLIEWLGAGGMGRVFSAYDPALDRKVAVKLVRPGSGDAARAQALLSREAKAIARLIHPHVLTVHDVGMFGEDLFIAMEYAPGGSLRDWLRKEPRRWSDTLSLFLQAGQGLAAAHQAGLVHRDFKPDNVLLGADGRARVMDFGLAQLQEEREAPPASAAELGGTLAYMAPEALRGERVDARSDQYSFCVSLYEALYGQLPSAGDSSSRVPSWLRRVVMRGLATSPEERFPTMEALLNALSRGRGLTRRRVLSLAAAALCVMAAGAGARAWLRRPAALCAAEATHWTEGVWDAPSQQRVRAAFLASGKPQAKRMLELVTREITAYASGWKEARQATCLLSHSSTPAVVQDARVRSDCLDGRRAELRSAVRLLADGAPVDRAAKLVGGLSSLEDCETAEREWNTRRLPAEPELRRKAAAVVLQLSELIPYLYANRAKEGIPLAERALAEARSLKLRALEAEALLVLADLQEGMAPEKVEKLLEEAVWLAEASRHDEVAARAWTSLLIVVGVNRGDFERAKALEARATAAVERITYRGAWGARGKLALVQGSLAMYSGRPAQALEHYRRALAIVDSSPHPPALDRATALFDISNVLVEVGKVEEAKAPALEALAIAQRELGPDSPTTAMMEGWIGQLELDEGELSQAISRLEEARRVQEQGPDAMGLAVTVLTLANAYRKAERFDEARALYDRGDAMLVKATGPDNPQRYMTYEHLGLLASAQKQYPEAIAHLQRALSLAKTPDGSVHPKRVGLLAELGEVHLKAGAPLRALPPLEEAVRLGPQVPTEPQAKALARFLLGRALWESRRDRPRGMRLVEEAQELAAPLGGGAGKELRAELQAWRSKSQPRTAAATP